MERIQINQLIAWKNRENRKPLILRGARQVGKTWLMKEFGKRYYDDFIYLNFEDDEPMKSLFATDFDMDRICQTIEIYTNKRLAPSTLLLLDEIQEAERGVTALKYFCEKRRHLHVIAAGSLLGIANNRNDSFPVGKVDFVDVGPLSFFEFLMAEGQTALVESIEQRQWELLAPLSARLRDYLLKYYYVGGMPEPLQTYLDTRDFAEVRRVQNAILDTYDNDFSKHAPSAEVPRIRMVWNSIRGQLARENKKFIFGTLKQGARSREFELAIEWLRDAGLVHKVNRTKKGLMPLSAYEDFAAFKLFMLDVGLMVAMSKLSPQILIEGNALFLDAKGAFAEQYVLQQLKACPQEMDIYYWSAENSSGEIDFLLQTGDKIIPVEVKAEENLRAKSLRAFVDANQNLHGVRLSMSPYREQEWMTNFPLYAVNCIL
ncbi:MAG: ATP-binding protein [Bacteroidales bacterium]|nr:ATP-binding protein [Bacteroidales bacterium]